MRLLFCAHGPAQRAARPAAPLRPFVRQADGGFVCGQASSHDEAERWVVAIRDTFQILGEQLGSLSRLPSHLQDS